MHTKYQATARLLLTCTFSKCVKRRTHQQSYKIQSNLIDDLKKQIEVSKEYVSLAKSPSLTWLRTYVTYTKDVSMEFYGCDPDYIYDGRILLPPSPIKLG